MYTYGYINHCPQLKIRTDLPGMTYMVRMMLVLTYMLLSMAVAGDLGMVLLMLSLLLPGLLMLNLSCFHTMIVIMSIH
jgi:hypothetical protein